MRRIRFSTMLLAVAQLHETELDGVRCFWVDTGRPTLAAMLRFRQGMADEPIAEAGWLHLLEHMALKDRDHGGLAVNGGVSLLDTTFQAHGPTDDVVGFLAQLTTWLADPGFDELAIEAKVLQSELALRGLSPPMSALTMRYGTNGPGTVGFGEPGLGRATPEALASRARRIFTQGNAVLILDGPPPAGLRLHLPPGSLIPITPALPCEDELPAAYASDAGLVVSGVVPRRAAMAIGHDLLRRRLSERLREEQGAAHAPWSIYEPVDTDHAVVVGGSDLHPDALTSIAETTLALVRDLARIYPGGQEVSELKASYIQQLTDPYAQLGIAVRAAHEFQRGRRPMHLEEIVDEIESITSPEVHDGWQEFVSTMMLGLPAEASWNDALPVLSFPDTVPTRGGKRFRSVNWPDDRSRLTIDPDGVEVSVGDRAQRVPTDDVAALLTFDEDRRRVVRHDGYGLSIDAQAWRGGGQAVALLDAAVPAHLHLPQPAGDGSSDVGQTNALRRWFRPIAALLLRPFRALDRVAVLAFLVFGGVMALAVVMFMSERASALLPLIVLVLIVRLLIGARTPRD